jgi:rsbT antagonist protein RsbS
MVQLGLKLEGVATALDLEEGLAYLDQKTKRVARAINEQKR